MKHGTFDEYPKDSLELPEKAILTIWDCLARYQEDLVLVGGLAVRHLTKPLPTGLPGPVTLDVDFGVNIGASGGQYPGIRDTLSGHGFAWKEGRFQRSFGEKTLYVDLLTHDAESDRGTVAVDDGLGVSIFPGIERALQNYRNIEINGMNLLGVSVRLKVKVAEVGPLLVLKLNAYGGPEGRKAGKDAHDILLLVSHYLEGSRKASQSFASEKAAGNRGFPAAQKCLEQCFTHPEAEGPMACATFRLGYAHNEGALADESLRLRQQCVTLAEALLNI
jgi:predicted nucleotidyltransferase